MKKLIITGILGLLLAACSPASDEPDFEPTAPEDVVRYFTITNGDSRYTLFYMGGLPLSPQEVSQPLELHGDAVDYTYYWGVNEKFIKATLHVDMEGEPHGITQNYTVVYE